MIRQVRHTVPTKESAMEQARQLVTHTDAMRLSGLPRRTFFKRIKGHGIVIYTDPDDRRRRWTLRSDVEKIAAPLKRREPSRA